MIPAPRNYPPILTHKVDQFAFYYAAARRGNTYVFSLAQITLCNGTSMALRGERKVPVDFQGSESTFPFAVNRNEFPIEKKGFKYRGKYTRCACN